ncbi:hypothetical protein AVEN_174237-1 [Araneus ventricosus]|uniref:Uncharacterized protein n=1 Tax=Araneus ventricosus TaxID=182803 RepID=A0A4Y2UCC4_ARAVE|nr:hypothetical protein AVEN_174237-1 [Araneus ventricosus]
MQSFENAYHNKRDDSPKDNRTRPIAVETAIGGKSDWGGKCESQRNLGRHLEFGAPGSCLVCPGLGPPLTVSRHLFLGMGSPPDRGGMSILCPMTGLVLGGPGSLS